MMLSIAIPVLAECDLLQNAVPKVLAAAAEITDDFELILATDGPECFSLATMFKVSDDRIRHTHSDLRRGKGGAITDALACARGDIFCFLDVDLSTDLRHLKELITLLKEDRCDILVGTRTHNSSTVERSKLRELISRTYISYVKRNLNIRVSDIQCGFKGFKTSVLRNITRKTHETGWTWDTEILARAQHDGYRIMELPIIWKQNGQRTNVRKRDAISMAFAVKRIRKELESETNA